MSGTRLERQGSPRGFKRLLFRSPIPFYRAGLGFLFGRRFLMLEHEGRKTGQTRRTVLEVVVDDPDAAHVAAAWGGEAQWLKNVRANPSVRFYLGSHHYETVAEMVTTDEAQRLMSRYAEEHPTALDKLARFMLDDPGDTIEEQASRVATTIPMVRLPKR